MRHSCEAGIIHDCRYLGGGWGILNGIAVLFRKIRSHTAAGSSLQSHTHSD